MTPMNQPEQNTIRQNYPHMQRYAIYTRSNAIGNRKLFGPFRQRSEIPSTAEKAREVAIDTVVTLNSTRNYIYM